MDMNIVGLYNARNKPRALVSDWMGMPRTEDSDIRIVQNGILSRPDLPRPWTDRLAQIDARGLENFEVRTDETGNSKAPAHAGIPPKRPPTRSTPQPILFDLVQLSVDLSHLNLDGRRR